ncbi:hypothetical protein J1614_000031 [Plenodomus biglobosus]|nr:hypothetical protein J1614_000031 [Plenodomus biglobosus]
MASTDPTNPASDPDIMALVDALQMDDNFPKDPANANTSNLPEATTKATPELTTTITPEFITTATPEFITEATPEVNRLPSPRTHVARPNKTSKLKRWFCCF